MVEISRKLGLSEIFFSQILRVNVYKTIFVSFIFSLNKALCYILTSLESKDEIILREIWLLLYDNNFNKITKKNIIPTSISLSAVWNNTTVKSH